MRRYLVLFALLPFCAFCAVLPSPAKTQFSQPTLPAPTTVPPTPKTLSLREAIALALRFSPDVKAAESQRVLDKFGLEIIKQSYGIQWSPITASMQLQNGTLPAWTAGAGASITAPSGTTVSITQANNLLGVNPGVTTLKISQHLLQGFGFALNRIAYQNGMDAEKIAKLNFKNSVIVVVVTVINNYRALVSAYNSLKTTQQTLQSQEQTVWQYKLQVKTGQMAPSDLLQQESSLEQTRLSVTQQEDAIQIAYQNFLSALGLNASEKITIDQHIHMRKANIPTLARCITLALHHNIEYQTRLINLRATKRALITAKNARKWTLDMTSAVQLGAQRSVAGGDLADQGTNPTVGLNLSVPIDDIKGKEGVVAAEIGIRNVELQLHQDKENLILNVQTSWNSLENQSKQIHIAEAGIQLSKQTLNNEKLKLKYGQTSVLDVNLLETQLLTQRISLIGTEIDYLNSVTTFYQNLGLTLKRWHIHLRY